jgi:phage tail-like protein
MLGSLGGAASNPTQMGTVAPAAMAMKAASVATASTAKPEFGLSFRFQVEIGSEDLGEWSTCGGLKVTFNNEKMKWGGDYGGAHMLPVDAAFSTITLERAIEPDGSTKVQKWLKKAAWDWLVEAPDPQKIDGDQRGTIKLMNADNEAVLIWSLVGVRPHSWSGPKLDAASGKIALETLEIVHRGFTVKVMKGSSTKYQPPSAQAKVNRLSIMDDKNKKVEFANSPAKIGIGWAAKTMTTQTQGENGNLEQTQLEGGKKKYTVTGLVLVGSKTSDAVKQLLSWAPQQAKGAAKTTPKLKVQWGTEGGGKPVWAEKELTISQLKVDFTRFSDTGKPIRAEISTFELTEWPGDPKGASNTNPTSGGLTGRRARTIVLGDSLASLAVEAYGSGARWREIAEANGIDDPTRLVPGRVVYLPAAVELDLGEAR